MPPNLQPLGECSYNGFRFNERTSTTEYSVTPNWSIDGRTIASRSYRISLSTYFDNASTTDPIIRNAVATLEKPGGVLIYKGRGFGTPDINTGIVRDVDWGPKPGPVALFPTGAGRGVKLTWSVTATIPPCDDATQAFDLMDLSFTVAHQKDDAGFTTRTITGSLVIPNTRIAGVDLFTRDSPDLYRERVEPPLLRGFLRTYGPWTVADDKRRLDFSIVDTELAGEPLPPGVIEFSGSESLRSSKVGLQTWEGGISASYRLARGYTGMDAMPHFLALIQRRTFDLQRNLLQVPNSGDVIPTSIEFTNPNLNGKPQANCSATFSFTVPLRALLAATGIWRSIRLGYTWDAWQASVENILSPYGTLRLTFLPADDAVVSLCGQGGATLVGGTGGFWSNLYRRGEERGRPPSQEQRQATLVSGYLGRSFPAPSPKGSYMAYENEIFAEFDSGVVPVVKLPSRPLEGLDDVFGRQNDFAGAPFPATNLPFLPPGFPVPRGTLVAQPLNYMRRVAPICYLYMRGYAIRAGYPIDPPRLLDVNGVEPIPACRLDRGEGFGRSIRANGGVPIHLTRWNVRYWLPRIPETPMPIPSNPMAEAR